MEADAWPRHAPQNAFSAGPPPQLPREHLLGGVQVESRCRAGSGRGCTAASWMSPSLLPLPRLHVLSAHHLGFQEHWGVERVLFCTKGSRQR